MAPQRHADQLSLLPPDVDLRVIYLWDRVVSARIDATLVSPGALNPVAAQLVDVIASSGKIRLDALTAPFGDTPEIKSMIGEVVFALARAGRVFIDASTPGVLITDCPSTNWLECTFDYITHTAQFLPTAELLGRRLPASRSPPAECAPVFNHEWVELYDHQALQNQIGRVYAHGFHAFKGQSNIEESNEILRRARLQRSEAHPRSVSVTIEPLREIYMLHRCFLYQAGDDAGTWTVVVRQLNSSRNVKPYTRLMVDRINDPDFLERLKGAADVVKR